MLVKNLFRILHLALAIQLMFGCFSALQSQSFAQCIVENPQCEYLKDPLGIDESAPRLSWIIKSEQRGQLQTAYQVIVADSKEALAEDQGTLWDSGKVQSDNTTAVVYEGKPLNSNQRCFWKVRVWDKNGQPSPWSSVSLWSMGLLKPGDWQSDWIGYDAERKKEIVEAPFDGVKWICHPNDDPQAVPAGNRVYVAKFELPEDVVILDAEVLGVADDKLWVAVNGKMVVHGEVGWEKVKPMPIIELLQPGANEMRFNVENSSEGTSALLAKVIIKTSSGENIEVVSDESWLAYDSPGMYWPSEPQDEAKLKPAQVVGEYGVEPWGTVKLEGLFLPPVPQFRSSFQLSKPVAAATLHVSAMGICDAYVNGQRVTDDFFTPGWCDYDKRLYYRTYDVTDQITDGENVVGAELADGWYCGYVGWGRSRDHYGDRPRLRLQLNVTYQDGTSEVIGSDSSWKAIAGPTREADFLMGEVFDARLADGNWCRPGFDDSSWNEVQVGADKEPILQPHPGPPVTVVQEFSPKSINQPSPGVYVFDLGQNFAGVVRLQVKGKPGQKITLRYAERLSPDGNIYTANLRGARTIDTYVCRGEGVETWVPRFTFHGYQYVEVTGLTEEPDTETVTGIPLSSNTPRAGWFECSDPQLNQLHNNILWTQYANFIDVPTDCPQRDERLGWTGDAQVYVATACLNTDGHAFFKKWLVDLADGQREDGQFPMVAPLKVAGDDGGPAWADAGVICPWAIYQAYDDERLLAEHYESMKRFVEFNRNRSKENLLPPDEFHCFGDWLSINADTPKEVIYTAYFAHCARLLSQAAEVLGKQDDAKEYAELHAKIKAAFNEAYVKDDGTVLGDTQCCYVLAIANNLLDEEKRQLAAEHLVADIAERDYHLSTGFVGTKDLMLALAAIGRNDIAYRLIHNDTFPSWGFSIKHGATSIWERWDGWTPERGFHDPGMNSFAHYSFGAVYQWIVENIGGIRSLQPGYKKLLIAPQIGGELTWANTDYDSIRGRISSHWKVADGELQLDVSIPANTMAEVRLPVSSQQSVRESGTEVARAQGVVGVKSNQGETVLQVGSGDYSFTMELED